MTVHRLAQFTTVIIMYAFISTGSHPTPHIHYPCFLLTDTALPTCRSPLNTHRCHHPPIPSNLTPLSPSALYL